jgi:hypothetical protein
MTDEPRFTLADVLNTQKALRDAAGAKEEELDLADLAGITGEELELLQEQGKSWDEMAAIVQSITAKSVTGAELEKAYNSLEEDDRWESEDEDYEDDEDRR